MQLNSQHALLSQLTTQYNALSTATLLDLFATDAQRAECLTHAQAGLTVDFSKNLISSQVFELLYELAVAQGLHEKIADLFAGRIVNQSEHQAAEHVILRDLGNPRTQKELARLEHWVDQIRAAGITDIVHMGIGGSDLGPRLVCEALKGFRQTSSRIHFLSSHDAIDVSDLLSTLNPETTLFLVVSKSFTTQETMLNWQIASQWLQAHDQVPSTHCLAITARPERAEAMGIPATRVLPLWETIGGRYSLWSAVGLVIAVWIGMSHFKQLLNGAYAMDQSFQATSREAPSVPVLMGLLSFWYGHFFHFQSQAVVSYSQRLRRLPDYLQQLHMESLGKRVTQDGAPIDYPTGMVVWGGVGTDCQHSFHQLFMQGHYRIPVDFILPMAYGEEPASLHLVAHCLAQSETLMRGYHNTTDDHRYIPGNNPSTMIIMD